MRASTLMSHTGRYLNYEQNETGFLAHHVHAIDEAVEQLKSPANQSKQWRSWGIVKYGRSFG